MLDGNAEEASNGKPAQLECIFHTVFETAIILGVAPSTVYDMHHAGVLTIRKIGKKSAILKTEIAEYVQNSVMPRGVDKSRAVGKYHPNKKMKAAAPADKTAEAV